jgi:hypothetical protein
MFALTLAVYSWFCCVGEKDFNYFEESKVFMKMLDDLKSSESDGIEINRKKFAVRVRLI